MKDVLHRFIEILKIELEDLEQDISDLLELWQKRMNKQEISPYVYLENKTLLLNEIAGIKSLINSLDTLDTRGFATKEDLFLHIDRMVHTRAKEGAFPEGVYNLVKRRMDKVIQYLAQ